MNHKTVARDVSSANAALKGQVARHDHANGAQLPATTATAGVPLTFHVNVRDEFGNSRSVQDDANADCSTVSTCRISAYVHALLSPASVMVFASIASQNSSSNFTGSLTPSTSVLHTFAAGLQFPGGLCATYYRSPDFFDAFAVEYAAAAVVNSTVASRFKWPPVSARWSGFILLRSSCSVTFLISSSNAFSIFFDSSELISNRPDAFNPATSFTATSRVLSSSHFFQGAIECSGVANPAAAAVIIFIFIIIIIIIIVVIIIFIIIIIIIIIIIVNLCIYSTIHI